LSLAALFATFLVAPTAWGQSRWASKPLSFNAATKVETAALPLIESTAPKKLWAHLGGRYGQNFYAAVYHFGVVPGRQYTISVSFPADGVYRNVYVFGENPLTDPLPDHPKFRSPPKGRSSGFTFLASDLPKVPCSALTRRRNFTVAPDSEGQVVYVLATSRTPAQSVIVTVKDPPDPDALVDGDTEDPACPARKGHHWGQVEPAGLPLFLRLDPTGTTRSVSETTRSVPETTPPPVVARREAKEVVPPPPIGEIGRRTTTPMPRGIAAWVAYVKSGQPFLVRFDLTMNKFNDARYTGDWRTDPMGTLQGGQEYVVSYRNGEFTCTGFSQADGTRQTHASGGIDPDDGLISLWSRTYSIDGQGQVWDLDFGLVGHIRPQ
jgi:hypothetical protein